MLPARCPTRPGSPPAAVSTRAAPRSPTAPRTRRASPTPAAARRRSRCASGAGAGTTSPATSWRPESRAERGERALQAALPREHVRRRRGVARERERCCCASGLRRTPGRPRPRRARRAWPWWTWSGESVAGHRDETAAARGVQRLPPPRLPDRPAEPGAEPVCAAARSLRCPYHSWTYALDGRLLRAPHTEDGDIDPADFSLHPVGVEAWARVRVRAPHAGRRSRFADGVAGPRRDLGNYDLGSLVTGLTLTYDVAANWKVLAENYNECYHCGPVHPELCGWCRRSAAAARTSRGRTASRTARAPGRSRCRHDRPGAAARAREAEQVRHKGELVYPNLMLSCSADHVAAFVLRPRAVDRTGSTARCCSRGTRSRPPTSTPPTPATSGTWSTSRTGRSASRCSAACRRAPTRTAGSRRWRTTARTSGAGCCPGWRPDRPMSETATTYVVVGLGALGSAAARQLARGGLRSSGSSGSSSGTSAAPRTTRRASSGTATTRRPTCD